MSRGCQGRMLPDGRLHLQHGPIDLIVGAFGGRAAVWQAHAAAWARFQDILEGLVAELPVLRRPIGDVPPAVDGPVARRMVAACWPHRDVFVTPMAAVAGAVADEVLAAITEAAELERAYVNDGGDIALHLMPGRSLSAGLVADLSLPSLDGAIRVTHDLPVRGLATSGWRGRSQSFGIADAVTVLARTAAAADTAATLIANEVDVAHPAIRRLPAGDVKDDSDLGERLVTVEVGALPAEAVQAALDAGARRADILRARGLIYGAVLMLRQAYRVVGPLSLAAESTREMPA
jgi:uncharacterized protein